MHRKSIEAADTLRSDNEEESSQASDTGGGNNSGNNSNPNHQSGHDDHHGQNSDPRHDDNGDSSMDGSHSFSDSSQMLPITSDANHFKESKMTKKGKKKQKKGGKSINSNNLNRSPSPASSRYSVDSIVHGPGHGHGDQMVGHRDQMAGHRSDQIVGQSVRNQGSIGHGQQSREGDFRTHSIASLRARAMEHSAKVLQSLDGSQSLTQEQAAQFFYRHHHQSTSGSTLPGPGNQSGIINPYTFQMNPVRPIY